MEPGPGSTNEPEARETANGDKDEPKRSRTSHIGRFLWRGLAISLPPILTLVILLWIFRGINDYIIYPTSLSVRYVISQFVDDDVRQTDTLVNVKSGPPLEYCGRNYRVTAEYKQQLDETLEQIRKETGIARPELNISDIDEDHVYVPVGTGERTQSVPYRDYVTWSQNAAEDEPATVRNVYMTVVTDRYFQSLFHLSAVAVALVVILLYFLGRFVTAKVGAWLVGKFESKVLGRVPLVSNVYGSVKQVTDFFFSERQVEYNRVVAIEYPRRGIWSLGFVTGDSLIELTAAAGEPLVSVLMPTSPMPMTGFTISVPRSEVLDLNITIDQAFQFCISCGVLVPPEQKVTSERLQQELTKQLSQRLADGSLRKGRPPGIIQSTVVDPPRDEPSNRPGTDEEEK